MPDMVDYSQEIRTKNTLQSLSSVFNLRLPDLFVPVSASFSLKMLREKLFEGNKLAYFNEIF